MSRLKQQGPLVVLLAFLVVQIAAHWLLPGGRVIRFPWSLLGVLPLAGGIALASVAEGAFKRVGTPVSPAFPPTALVTSGVYARSRHPMYLGFALAVLGVALLLGSLVPLLLVAAFVVVADRVLIAPEERTMAGTFGAAWTAYAARVRRWL